MQLRPSNRSNSLATLSSPGPLSLPFNKYVLLFYQGYLINKANSFTYAVNTLISFENNITILDGKCPI